VLAAQAPRHEFQPMAIEGAPFHEGDSLVLLASGQLQWLREGRVVATLNDPEELIRHSGERRRTGRSTSPTTRAEESSTSTGPGPPRVSVKRYSRMRHVSPQEVERQFLAGVQDLNSNQAAFRVEVQVDLATYLSGITGVCPCYTPYANFFGEL
jgi:hypothetical protein